MRAARKSFQCSHTGTVAPKHETLIEENEGPSKQEAPEEEKLFFLIAAQHAKLSTSIHRF